MDATYAITMIVISSIGVALSIAALSFQSDTKKDINYQLDSLEERLDSLFKKSKVVEENLFVLADRIAILEKAEHGLKKDGTPRAKPGRKAK